jgi:hypothetical protein
VLVNSLSSTPTVPGREATITIHYLDQNAAGTQLQEDYTVSINGTPTSGHSPYGGVVGDELVAELHAVPRLERPFWVLEQLDVALFEGLWSRVLSGRPLDASCIAGASDRASSSILRTRRRSGFPSTRRSSLSSRVQS